MNKLPLTPSLCPKHIDELITTAQLVGVLQSPDVPEHLKAMAEEGLLMTMQAHHEENQNEQEN